MSQIKALESPICKGKKKRKNAAGNCSEMQLPFFMWIFPIAYFTYWLGQQKGAWKSEIINRLHLFASWSSHAARFCSRQTVLLCNKRGVRVSRWEWLKEPIISFLLSSEALISTEWHFEEWFCPMYQMPQLEQYQACLEQNFIWSVLGLCPCSPFWFSGQKYCFWWD